MIDQERGNLSEEDVPYFQKLYDRPFFWLILGIVTMVVFYTLWGIYEIMSLKEAPLP